MSAPGPAAADLQIDGAFAKPVTARGFMQHDVEGTNRHEQSIPRFRQRTLQTLHLPLAVDQHAVSNGDRLVDALGELVTAVLYMNRGHAMGQITSIDIGYPAHTVSIP
jgi:hypothetical protein